ncbi:unnamed protein product [Owenia fusiformis]|uniref:Uncharacterized protein n=1 Tax=Owenia fusiformis TaxID=6347 RepID=A0A8J1UT45_OWEFU|nr:unnamed protein product [Owenia fusiformis]
MAFNVTVNTGFDETIPVDKNAILRAPVLPSVETMSFNSTMGVSFDEVSNTSASVYTDVIEIPEVRYIMLAFHATGILVAALGNAIVLLIIYRKRSFRHNNAAIYFIMNLALCDLTLALIHHPMRIMDMYLAFASERKTPPAGLFFHNRIFCQLTDFFSIFTCAVGFHTIVAISQERLLLICYPLKAKILCSVTNTKKVMILIWMTSFAMTIPIPILYSNAVTIPFKDVNVSLCVCLQEDSNSNPGDLIYFVLLFIIYYTLPLVVITISYIKIFRALYHTTEALGPIDGEEGCHKTLKTRHSLAKMMLTVAVAFAVCWGPTFGTFLFMTLGGSIKKHGIFLINFVELLPLLNSALHPFIYTLNSRAMRRGFKTFICFRRRYSFDDHSMTSGGGTTYMYRGSNQFSSFVHRQASTTFSNGSASSSLLSPRRRSMGYSLKEYDNGNKASMRTSNTYNIRRSSTPAVVVFASNGRKQNGATDHL